MHVIAIAGSGFSDELEEVLLDEYVLSLARRRRPRVSFVPTASGELLLRAA
jgi:dipeptidase E